MDRKIAGSTNITPPLLLLLFCILSIFCQKGIASAYDIVKIDNTPEPIGRYLEYYEDAGGHMNFEDILTLTSSDKGQGSGWIQSELDAITAGFTKSTYWVRFTVENSKNTAPWILEVAYPLLDVIELYSPNSNNEYRKITAGDSIEYAKRPIDYRNIAFPIFDSKRKTSTYYMRFKTESSMQILLKKWPNQSFAEAIDKEKILFGILFGIIIFSIISNLSGGFFLRETVYLWAASTLLMAGFYLASVSGLTFQYFWPNSLWVQSVSIPFFINATYVFGILFSRGFLDIKYSHPTIDRGLSILSLICCALMLLSLILPYETIIRISTSLVLIFSTSLLATGLISLTNGNKFARYYIAGWGVALIGTVAFSLKSLGVIPATPFSIWSQEIGFGAMGIFIAFALSDRFFQMQKKQDVERDISLVALENAEKKYRSLFENAIEGIFQMDLDGYIISANHAFSMIVGTSGIDKTLNSIYFPYSLCCLEKAKAEHLQSLLSQLHFVTDYEACFSIDTDEIRWINISIKLIRSDTNDPLHYEGSLADITESKKREQAEKDMRMAEASTEAKSLFLANMSHEIRTPMNAILGFTGLAIDVNKDERITSYLRKTRAASSNLLGIINDILDFSKIEAGKLEIDNSPFSAKEVLENLESVVSDMAYDKNLELTIEIDPDIPDALIGDPMRIGQILLNLTNNAIKFTHKGSISVKLDLLMLDKQDLSISLRGSISDTGIGIEENAIKRLFSAFAQADSSTTRQFGGTGLGLSISKQLAQLMGGEFYISSELGKGSTFSFDIHCQLQDDNKNYYSTSPSVLEGLRALIVDDQSDSQELLKKALHALNIDAIAVASSDEAIQELALKEAQGFPYDIMLVDWLMPDTDGITCCQLIKNNSSLTTPYMILVTGYGQESTQAAAREAGIEGYLLKPLQVPELSSTLLRFFQNNVPNINKTKSLKGVNVLVTEDVIMNQELATEILTKAGMTVVIANNGLEAVNAVQQYKYDVVLMDMQMPIMGGEEATQKIRTFNGSTPIIAMTANAMTTDKEKCLAAGMNDYVAKPIDPELLFAAIRRWVPDLPEAEDSNILGSKSELTEHQLPEKLPGIDIQEGLLRTQQNIPLYLKMLSDFKRTYGSSSQALNDACASDDREAVERLAHTIKGLAANLSANPLADVAAKIETLAETSITDISPLLEEFSTQLAIFLDSIDLLKQQEQKACPNAPDTADATHEKMSTTDVATLMKNIETLIEHQKLEAYDKAEELSRGWPSDTAPGALADLLEALDQFDFPAASAILERLKEKLSQLINNT